MKAENNHVTGARPVCYEEEPIIEIELDTEECNTIIASLTRDFRSCVNELAEYPTFEEEGERENLVLAMDLGVLILKMINLRDALLEDDTE